MKYREHENTSQLLQAEQTLYNNNSITKPTNLTLHK